MPVLASYSTMKKFSAYIRLATMACSERIISGMECVDPACSAMAYSARCRRSARARREIASYRRLVSACWRKRLVTSRPSQAS
ncbi:hypothetical protein UU5_03292 [Rhodanobacter sp. 115]|nr:hypothetical protein UU5_03292 [Rhodanobacter sp. 115]